MGWVTTESDEPAGTCCDTCLEHSIGRELTPGEKGAVRERALAQFREDCASDPGYAADTAELLARQPELSDSFEWVLELLSGNPTEQVRMIQETIG